MEPALISDNPQHNVTIVQHIAMLSYITQEYPLTFQNCLLASLPPTRFKILAPPGCSSTNPSILYTSLSIIMCKPLSTLPASLTSLAVNSFDMLVDFGRGFGIRVAVFVELDGEDRDIESCVYLCWRASVFVYTLGLLPRMVGLVMKTTNGGVLSGWRQVQGNDRGLCRGTAKAEVGILV
jgi:hypothetical protein